MNAFPSHSFIYFWPIRCYKFQPMARPDFWSAKINSQQFKHWLPHSSPSVCSDKGLTLETSAIQSTWHINPCWSSPYLSQFMSVCLLLSIILSLLIYLLIYLQYSSFLPSLLPSFLPSFLPSSLLLHLSLSLSPSSPSSLPPSLYSSFPRSLLNSLPPSFSPFLAPSFSPSFSPSLPPSLLPSQKSNNQIIKSCNLAFDKFAIILLYTTTINDRKFCILLFVNVCCSQILLFTYCNLRQ